MDLTISEDGLQRLHLTAAHVLKYERPDSSFMLLQSLEEDTVRVRVDIFDTVGDSSAIVFADRIYYYELENRFEAQGNVNAASSSGSTIKSEHLAWTESDRKLRTPGFATIISPGQSMAGYNLEANEDLTDATLERVVGTFEPQEESGETSAIEQPGDPGVAGATRGSES